MSSHCENYVWLNELSRIVIPESNNYFTAYFGKGEEMKIIFYDDDYMVLRSYFLGLAARSPEKIQIVLPTKQETKPIS